MLRLKLCATRPGRCSILGVRSSSPRSASSSISKSPWYLREPEPVDEPDPAELEIAQVVDPADFPEFEDVSVRGFGGEDAVTPVGSIHPPVSDPRLVNWIGRVDGVAVGAAMTYRSPQAVGVFGVTVIESARGRGYGTALTRRSLLLELGLPAILGPSPEAESMYRRLGFRHVGEARHWRRPGPVSRTEPEAVCT